MPSRTTSPRTSALNRVRERVKAVSSRYSSNPQSQDTSLLSTSSQTLEEEVRTEREGVSKNNTSIERKYQEEVIKIHALWKQAKSELKHKDDELRENRRELERERSKLQEAHAVERAHLMRELERVKVEMTEREREYERREQSLRSAVRDMGIQMEKAEEVMQRAMRQRDEQEGAAAEAREEIARLQEELKEIKMHVSSREKRLQQVLTSLEEENKSLSSAVQAKSDELEGCLRRLKQGDADNEESSKQIQRMLRKLDASNQQAEELREQVKVYRSRTEVAEGELIMSSKIVDNLRGELRLVQDELEEMKQKKRNQTLQMDQQEVQSALTTMRQEIKHLKKDK
ncbi:hypothetical protein GUITHDRAFT_118086, partial [Guillardia theta CCMP2712]